MNRVYLHIKKNNNLLIKIFLLLFVPFILYGLYKNGIDLHLKGYISKVMMFKPLYFILISIIISISCSLIRKEKILSEKLLSNIMIGMIVPYNTNIFIYAGILLVANIVLMFMKYHHISIVALINLLILYITHNFSFLNIYESSVAHNYGIFDYFIGKGSGGISNTLIAMTIISFIILCINNEYKRQITITSSITYYLLLIITSIITKNVDINLYLNSNLLFAMVFILPISSYSPYTKGGIYVYSLLYGIMVYISTFINLNIGVYISLLLMSSGYLIINKVFKKNKINVK